MRKRRGVRWRRVVVWWVVLTVVMVGVEVGALIGIGHRAKTGRIARDQWYGAPVFVDEPFGSAMMWRIGSAGLCLTEMELGSGYDPNYSGTPTREELLEKKKHADEHTRRNVGSAWLGPVMRLQAVLENLRIENGREWSGRTIDVRLGVPLGVALAADDPTVLSRSVRAEYPTIVTLRSGKLFVFVRFWNVVGLAVVASAVCVGVLVGFSSARRAVRRRRGRCAWCGYSLVGIAGDAVCPECGEGRELKAES